MRRIVATAFMLTAFAAAAVPASASANAIGGKQSIDLPSPDGGHWQAALKKPFVGPSIPPPRD